MFVFGVVLAESRMQCTVAAFDSPEMALCMMATRIGVQEESGRAGAVIFDWDHENLAVVLRPEAKVGAFKPQQSSC